MIKQRRDVGPIDHRTTGEKLDRFLLDNPTFVPLCARYAREFMVVTGSSVASIQSVVERARWDRSIELKTDNFKIDNNFCSYLARYLMATYADLDGVFVTRRADDADEWLAGRPEILGTLFAIPLPVGRR